LIGSEQGENGVRYVIGSKSETLRGSEQRSAYHAPRRTQESADTTGLQKFGGRARGVIVNFATGHQLSGRETEVLAAASMGLSTKETAIEMNLSGKTVEYFWTRIFKKVRCDSKLEVMSVLFRWALCRMPSSNGTDDTEPATVGEQGSAHQQRHP
jgi:DNA-binding CsgD family transcriptional regulator